MKDVAGVVITCVCLLLMISGCGPARTSGMPEPVEVDIVVRGLTPPTQDSFDVGDVVRIKDSGTILGTITSIEVEPARIAVADADGVLRESVSPLLVDVTLTLEGKADVSDDGFRFGRDPVRVNQSLTCVTRLVLFDGVVASIEGASR